MTSSAPEPATAGAERVDARRLHIVAHNGGTTWGGGELGTVLLLAALQERGHRVRMFFRSRELAERAAAQGIPSGVRHLGGPVALHHAAAFARELRALRPDVVLLTTLKKVFLAALAARWAGIPEVVQRVVLQGSVPRRFHQRLALRRWVDRVVLNAEAMRAGFMATDAEMEPARVVTILDGVRPPIAGAAPARLRSELRIPQGAPVIGAVARLAHQKRFDRLVDALALLPRDVHCVLAGDGGMRGRILRRAEELGVRERLHLLGFRHDVGDVLAALDLFVVSSDSEGMSNAMLEALAAGVPVVSTDVSGAREALEPLPDGRWPGLVVERNAGALAAALLRLLRDPALRRSAGDAARQRAEDRFGWDRFVDEWEALLLGEAAP